MGSKSLLLVLVGVVAFGVTLVLAHPQLFVEDGDRYRELQPVQPVEVEPQETADDEPLTRTRRDSMTAGDHHHSHGGWGWPKKQVGWGWQKGWGAVGPVFTYVRTDGWSNFQWGVRHKVGGKGGWGK